MKLTMSRVVVVLNICTRSFGKNILLHLSFIVQWQNLRVILRTTTTRHMKSFIDFHFHFLTSPHMFSIFTHVMKRVRETNSEHRKRLKAMGAHYFKRLPCRLLQVRRHHVSQETTQLTRTTQRGVSPHPTPAGTRTTSNQFPAPEPRSAGPALCERQIMRK